jgi:predicted membrane protein
MNYMLSRDGQEFGPYALADLQSYVATGDILLTDMVRSEGMTDFLPVSQVIGTIPVPAPVAPISMAAQRPEYPYPPNLPWWLVLIFDIVTLGMFEAAWGLVLAIWMKKLAPSSKAVYYYVVYALCLGCIFALSFMAAAEHTQNPMAPLLNIVVLVFSLVARYSLKNSLEEHYNNVEPMGLQLSGVMTFFFSTIYFQYHLNDIVRRKKLDEMDLYSSYANPAS